MDNIIKIIVIGIITVLMYIIVFLIPDKKAHSDIWKAYSNGQIADAIWYAEGGNKAKVPYGILSIKTNNPRQICLNTIKNHRIRHDKHYCKLDFITCLGNRYAPVNCNNDNGTNRFWIKNVKYFLKKG